MSAQDWVLVAAAVVLSALLLWFFFGPKKTRRAELDAGVQTVTVTVKGGYSPDLIEVAPGVPVRLVFDRQETGDCSSRVVLPDFQINQPLPSGSLDISGTLGWTRGAESLDLTVTTPAPLHYNQACGAVPQRIDEGELHAEGIFDGSPGYVRVRWTECGRDPEIRFVALD